MTKNSVDFLYGEGLRYVGIQMENCLNEMLFKFIIQSVVTYRETPKTQHKDHLNVKKNCILASPSEPNETVLVENACSRMY